MILTSFWVKLIAETLPDLASGAGPNRFPKSRRTNRETERVWEQERKSRGRGARQRGDGVADSLAINKNQISGRIAQSQTAIRFAYAVAFCALCTLRRMCSVCGEGGKRAWQPSSSPIRSPACIKQRRLGSCFVGTTCFGPNSRYLHRLEAPPLPLQTASLLHRWRLVAHIVCLRLPRCSCCFSPTLLYWRLSNGN